MTSMTSFIRRHVVSNLSDFLYCVQSKMRYLAECQSRGHHLLTFYGKEHLEQSIKYLGNTLF